jgi:hypothetical protein
MPVFDGPGLEAQGPNTPYDARLKAEIETDDATTLGEIIDAAAMRFGISSPQGRVSERLTGVVFFVPSDAERFQRRDEPWPKTIRTVTPQGTPSWVVRWCDVRFGELLAASDAGMVEGDPYRPYLWPVIPQGNAGQTFLDALWSLWLNWEHLLAAYGTYELARPILDRIKRARAATRARGWSSQKALERPQDLMPLLDASPRSDEIEGALGIPITQAAPWLEGLGYVCGDDERWRAGCDGAASALHQTVLAIEGRGRAPSVEEMKVILDIGEDAGRSEER